MRPEGIPSEEEFGVPALSGEVDAAARKAAEERVATVKSEEREALIASASALAALAGLAGAVLDIPAILALGSLALTAVALGIGRVLTYLTEGTLDLLNPRVTARESLPPDGNKPAPQLSPGVLIIGHHLSEERSALESLSHKNRYARG